MVLFGGTGACPACLLPTLANVMQLCIYYTQNMERDLKIHIVEDWKIGILYVWFCPETRFNMSARKIRYLDFDKGCCVARFFNCANDPDHPDNM